MATVFLASKAREKTELKYEKEKLFRILGEQI
ncbi:MAG: hypothetical protein ACI9DJ_003145 [Algoriphagus sp.]|jgi:hypothetical protein